jgi:cytochrome subunit of sulfide dehydrogenase
MTANSDLVLAAALLVAAAPAHAQDAAALHARSLAATCAHCHGTDGQAPPASAMRPLAGMPAPYLAEQLRAFRSGERSGSVMPQLAKGYSDAQIDRLAAYFAARPPSVGTPAVKP